MHSIKAKLIITISVLVIFLFSVTALLFIDDKRRELSRDIYIQARGFSELTTPKIVEIYKTLLAERSFVFFNREIKDIFGKNEDIENIKIITFAGEIVYDSKEERERQYEGAGREISDPGFIARVRSGLPSYVLENGRIVYLKKDLEGVYLTVDGNEKEVPEIADTDVIYNIVFPYQGQFAVVFDISYSALQARVVKTTERIVLLLVFGVLLGLGIGWYFANRITNPIEKLTAGALILSKGDFKARVNVKTRDEVGVLAETFNKMAQDLEISTKAMLERERLTKEIEVAARIQKQILPSKMPRISGLDIDATVIPAAEIGGDCYDFIQVDSDTNIFYISDVTGHGISSGIVVSIANAIIYSYAHTEDLKEILMEANDILKEKTTQNMFMTLLMVRYSKGVLDYVSAGHPEMLHYHAAEKKVAVEKGGGIALGMVSDVSKMLEEQEIDFRSGDCLLLYSDGITEAVSPHKEQYGLQRLRRAFNDHGELKSASAIKNAVIADVKEFMGDAKQLDDITLIVLRKT